MIPVINMLANKIKICLNVITQILILKIMKILFFSSKDFEQPYILNENENRHIVEMSHEALSAETAHLAKEYEAISIFTSDDASTAVIEKLYANGIKYIAVRAAGYDNVDIQKANELGIKVANVPEYSPHAIAEYTVAMILALNRKLMLADKQVHQNNFTIENLVGFNLSNKRVGIIGTGKIGSVVAKILHGFGCNIIAYDIEPNHDIKIRYGITYTDLETLCSTADIITIHTPLNEQTKYLINNNLIKTMKKGVMLINTARGAVVNTTDIIENLKNDNIGYYGMDVYEKEKGVFFYDYSNKQLQDEQLQQLMAMPNVLITPHQAFATKEALQNIAATTIHNLSCWDSDEVSENELPSKPVIKQEFIFDEEEA